MPGFKTQRAAYLKRQITRAFNTHEISDRELFEIRDHCDEIIKNANLVPTFKRKLVKE